MADLVQLACQGCGAPLQAGRDLTHVVCPYCHTDNLIKRSDSQILEASSQCPVCHRNDHTKKVSAIMASGGENARYFSKPQRPVRTQTVADLPQPPPPESPIGEIVKSANLLKYAYIAAFALAGLSLICSLSGRNNGSFLIFVIGFGVAGFFLLRKYRSESSRNNQVVNANQNRQAAYKNQLNRYQQAAEENARRKQEEDAQFLKWTSNWEAAVAKWNRLYYCDRDDCVFIPGEEATASLKDIEKFCYQKM